MLLSIDLAESDKVSTVGSGGDYKNKLVKRSSFKNLNKVAKFLISKARLAFTQLQKAFTKALILQHFDLEYHIWIETDVLCYAIGKVLCYLLDFR